MNIDKYIYESGLIASGCWDKFDDYDKKALEKFAEILVKKCAYLVNDYQRTKGYTDHAKMLCREFDIEYKDEDYYGVE